MTQIENFGDLLHAYMQLSEQREFQQALDVIAREEARFPVYKPVIYGWQMGLLAELGDTDGALASLEAALDAGYWYHEDALYQSPDFASVQGIPAFEALAERSKAARLQAQIEPQLHVTPPDGQPEPWPLLIALHSNLGSMAATAPYWKSAPELGWLTALPQSSQATWVSGFYVWDDQAQAQAELRQHYDTLIDQYPVDPARVVLAGYSMGGQITMHAALTGAIPARGLIGVEGWVFDLDTLPPLLDANANPDLRVYLVSGQGDMFRDAAPQLRDMLCAHGIACELEPNTVAYHGFPPDFDAVLRRALDFVMAG